MSETISMRCFQACGLGVARVRLFEVWRYVRTKGSMTNVLCSCDLMCLACGEKCEVVLCKVL